MRKELRWKLIGLSILGIILLNFPIIKLFAKKVLVANIPMLYLYILIIWLLFIIALYRLIDKPIKEDHPDPNKK
jgi:hypothetical protein